jgi:predicted RNA binding protein with dsRBD fold (UPF0201 family)
VYPTEDTNRISQSLKNIFPEASFLIEEQQRKVWINSSLLGQKSLETLRSIVHETRIIDAMRKIITSSWTGTISTIQLDKQALLGRKINLIDNSGNPPLGCVEIILSYNTEDEYESFLRWFTPLTKDGKIIQN